MRDDCGAAIELRRDPPDRRSFETLARNDLDRDLRDLPAPFVVIHAKHAVPVVP
jgi:hypothetical protein